MSSEIDDLMNLDPLDLTSDNKEMMIVYWRKMRIGYESGIKPTKKAALEGPKLDLVSLGLVESKSAGIRRI